MADETPDLRTQIAAAAQGHAKLLFETALYKMLISIEQEQKATRAFVEETLDNVIGLAMNLIPSEDDDEDEDEAPSFRSTDDEEGEPG